MYKIALARDESITKVRKKREELIQWAFKDKKEKKNMRLTR